MYKIYCALVIIFVASYVSCSAHIESINHFQNGNENTLQKDLCDFIDILPIEDVRNLTKHFYANDKQMRDSYDYLRNEGLKLIDNYLSQMSILTKFIGLLNDTGVNIKELNKKMEKLVLTKEETDAIAG